MWQDDFETESRFIYYGTGTRNEYRLTRFGRGFPFLKDDDIGSLLVICKIAGGYYRAYVLETEQEIEDYLTFFGISPDRANGLVSELSMATAELQDLIDVEKADLCSLKYRWGYGITLATSTTRKRR
jgi:hypothetical protein